MKGSAWANETLATYDRGAESLVARLADSDFDRYLSRFALDLPAGGAVLDLGCGGGRDLRWFVDRGYAAVGLDASTGMLAEARRRVPEARLVQSRLPEIPIGDESVDGVWSCAALLHLDKLEMAATLRGAARTLRPGGVLFASTAAGTDSEWRASPFGRRWFHYYEEHDLAEATREAGLLLASVATEAGVTRGRWVNLLAHKPR